jgi:Rho termination factor, N-terminal domain
MLLRRYHKQAEETNEGLTTLEDVTPKVEGVTNDGGEPFTSGDDSKGVELPESEVVVSNEDGSVTPLEDLSKTKLKELAKEAKVEGYTTMEKEQLIEALRGE